MLQAKVLVQICSLGYLENGDKRIMSSSPAQEKLGRLISQTKYKRKGWSMSQVIEHLPSMYETLGLIGNNP
jgi:hypothetical protein